MTPVLEVEGLRKRFPISRGVDVLAVDGVSFSVRAGRTLALVGESGCGKTTTTRLVARLLEPDSGSVRIGGRDVTHLRGRALRSLRDRFQIVFQDPTASLDPRWTVRQVIGEPRRVRSMAPEDPGAALDRVGLDPALAARDVVTLSSGQRQRVALARALALDPDLVVLDEPVSALDVSVRAQIVNLLADLQEARGLAYLVVTHDLALVHHLADEVAVMYLGRIVEQAPAAEIVRRPRHPYTAALLAATPVPDPALGLAKPPESLRGELPSPSAPPSGCAFRTRCPKAQPRCATETPVLEGGRRHPVACHFPEG